MSTTDNHTYDPGKQGERRKMARPAATHVRADLAPIEDRYGAIPRTLGLAAFAVLSFAAFIWFGHRADAGLPPTGGSEVTLLNNYSGAASLMLCMAVVSWALTLISAWHANPPFRGRALWIFGVLLPAGLSLAYVNVAQPIAN
jgi:hypothetical protein